MVLVDSDEVCAAMKDLFENVRAVAEPSGRGHLHPTIGQSVKKAA